MKLIDKAYHYLKGIKQLARITDRCNLTEEGDKWSFETLNYKDEITYFEDSDGYRMEQGYGLDNYRYYFNNSRISPTEFENDREYIYCAREIKYI